MEIRTIGIDLGKTVFHFVGVNARGQVVVRKKGSRTQLLRFTANLPQSGVSATCATRPVSSAVRRSTPSLRSGRLPGGDTRDGVPAGAG